MHRTAEINKRLPTVVAGARHSLRAEGGPTQRWGILGPGTTACQAGGFAPHIEHRVHEWHAILSLVAHGFGVSLLPRLAPHPAGVPVVRIPPRGAPVPARRMATCIRVGSHERPAVARGLAVLRRAAGAGATSACWPTSRPRPGNEECAS
ncbi:LysR substrate-binding domain-containing protein [Streptomyces sp. NPDC058375]|uniref:LysR substrate-binding domain-containing protein n=1 Tax=Streptomyces sp. NPDC058375 TaxID=3346467 RepID=UPI0036640D63